MGMWIDKHLRPASDHDVQREETNHQQSGPERPYCNAFYWAEVFARSLAGIVERARLLSHGYPLVDLLACIALRMFSFQLPSSFRVSAFGPGLARFLLDLWGFATLSDIGALY